MRLIYYVLSLLYNNLKETTLLVADFKCIWLKQPMMNEKKNQRVHEIKAINHFVLLESNSNLESQWF